MNGTEEEAIDHFAFFLMDIDIYLAYYNIIILPLAGDVCE